MAPDSGAPVLVPADQVRPNDVLLGRRNCASVHSGNEIYRKAIKARSLEYEAEGLLQKDSIAWDIINLVESSGGRFLRPATDGEGWVQCTQKTVRTKVKQALRDCTKEKPSQSQRHLSLPNSGAKGSQNTLLGNVGRTPFGETHAFHPTAGLQMGRQICRPDMLEPALASASHQGGINEAHREVPQLAQLLQNRIPTAIPGFHQPATDRTSVQRPGRTQTTLELGQTIHHEDSRPTSSMSRSRLEPLPVPLLPSVSISCPIQTNLDPRNVTANDSSTALQEDLADDLFPEYM